MSSNVHFSKMPSIAIPRTKMKMPFTHKLSWNFASVVPLMCKEILPGDTFRVDFAGLIRMSTPIAPILDNIDACVSCWFIPSRLLWTHLEEFYGANKVGAGPQTTEYLIPAAKLGSNSLWTPVVGSVSDYLGKPICGSLADGPMVSVLKERAYWLVIDEWFRAEQIMNPWVIDKSDNAGVATRVVNGSTTYIGFSTMPAQVTKNYDYFTACTLGPQYGSAVTLPLGSYAPLGIIKGADSYSPVALAGANNGEYLTFGQKLNNGLGSTEAAPLAQDYVGQLYLANDNTSGNIKAKSDFDNVTRANFKTNLVADLTNATAATVNTLRYAFAVQKYLERSNFGANRFYEILNVHYGVTSPDARLQRPEHLGEYRFHININTVLSTADAATGDTTKLGQPGANSTTAVKGHLFRKGFVEPGYVLVLISTYQGSHTYGQGVLREDLRRERFEFYTPEFANLGDQPVYKDEIVVASGQAKSVFGYQEHWAEYRYSPDQASSLLRANVTGSLDYWTLADNFAAVPTLSESFILENRDNLKRCLVTGDSGPDFIGDFFFDITAVRPMPAYTIPGLIDHFGTR